MESFIKSERKATLTSKIQMRMKSYPLVLGSYCLYFRSYIHGFTLLNSQNFFIDWRKGFSKEVSYPKQCCFARLADIKKLSSFVTLQGLKIIRLHKYISICFLWPLKQNIEKFFLWGLLEYTSIHF